MAKISWTPWHQVVRLRDDLKSGELSLAVFAADLYDVVMGKARPVYQDPKEFFSLTYPTFNLRELAKDVVNRLAGKNDKAIRQLELTYGGGKTHTLITMYHLVVDPAGLPKLPAVEEFVQHIGLLPPKARIAVLAFDKLDVEKGMEVISPKGEKRWLKNPWSVIAFQLAGVDGLRLLHAEGKDEERDSAPAENLLTELLGLPGKEDLSTLILIDEVLMYAREKVALDPAWRSKIINFFQYLTQAAVKVDRCAIVASLLATDPRKSDVLGKEITQELYSIFRREREEGVQPVVKDDVAEVLRRRFFTTDSIRDRESFRPHVVAALKGIEGLDEQTRKDAKGAEERFLRSYPFNPDLTDIFYSKWTNLEGFQRTRGVLRTFALALREASNWDECPLVSVNAFLGRPDRPDIAEAARELTTIAATEEFEGKKQEWTTILEGEFSKARQIQQDIPGLKFREVEQAVMATFLHSQPIGHKALVRDLFLLLGASRPDKIDMEKALRRWADTSWFLDEAAVNDAELGSGGQKQIPKAWRLGTKPNLRQMHHDACLRITPESVDTRLIDEISKLKSLTTGASAAGAKVHTLPLKPSDIEDDGEFHYGILGPKAASESGKPNPEARRFIEETTSPDRKRARNPNAVVLAVPARDGLDAARSRIREYIGWEEVRAQIKEQDTDPVRVASLASHIDGARKAIPESIKQLYSIVVTVSDKNDVHAFKVAVDDRSLFEIIKKDPRSRIQDTAVSAEALLPGGPYDLWKDGETSRRVNDLVGAFAASSRLPKMLRRKEILDTLVQGAREGFYVLQVTRPDRTVKTFWRQEPDEAAIKDPSLEVVLPEAALLSDLSMSLLTKDTLPGLWSADEITYKDALGYFAGGHVVKIKRDGYEESVAIPRVPSEKVEDAVLSAIKEGRLWLISGPASMCAEDVPAGVLTEDSRILMPPKPIAAMEVVAVNPPESWKDGHTTALTISVALARKAGKPLPWVTVREAIDGAIRARLLARTIDSAPWPCGFSEAQNVKLRLPEEQKGKEPQPPVQPPMPAGVRVAEAELRPNEIQELADRMGELVSAAVGVDLKFKVRIEMGGESFVKEDTANKVNLILEGISNGFKLK